MKNLLFSSVGDNTVFYKNWLNSETINYDICVCYYGNETNRKYEQYCTENMYFERKGSKFQNFYYIWNNYEKIKEYDQYFILDDDIIINADEINELFDILNKYDLWILQPSFSEESVISHLITKQNNDYIMRYVNFIEVCTMMFSKYAINKCMEIYNDMLVGYGVDYLFIWYLGNNIKDKYAIIYKITCVNPKRDIREINLLQPSRTREQMFIEIKSRHNFREWKHAIHSFIKK
jgi:hypothetical protein